MNVGATATLRARLPEGVRLAGLPECYVSLDSVRRQGD